MEEAVYDAIKAYLKDGEKKVKTKKSKNGSKTPPADGNSSRSASTLDLPALHRSRSHVSIASSIDSSTMSVRTPLSAYGNDLGDPRNRSQLKVDVEEMKRRASSGMNFVKFTVAPVLVIVCHKVCLTLLR